MDNLYWNVNSKYDKCKIFENNDINDIDEELLNSIMFNNCGIIKISLPVNYYSNKESYEIELFDDRPYTIKDILTVIYDFYNTDLTKEELIFVSDLYGKSNNILEKEYSKVREEYNKLLHKIITNNEGKRVELLGSRTVFEGLQMLKDNRYKLLLGY